MCKAALGHNWVALVISLPCVKSCWYEITLGVAAASDRNDLLTIGQAYYTYQR